MNRIKPIQLQIVLVYRETQKLNTVQEKLIIIPFHGAPSVLLVPLQARLLLDLHI